ncbi:glycine cleavage system pyridoxal-binding protein P [Paenibacillus cellulosilyticus]|uniref:Probable glycine dehydrogenase (decarboxylating) subunit 1 n=1 Tax=Paenibacillus cellulosilyticus TaxID=375489 RepID=A0A2V2YVB3_9BACL|nr:aminomethyl-transferring glycine dehydrogenase subunit GcvPA [Paenibacillus cellulosilyticus]PWV94375.1 glycine cleavage system pyridoxal-binding protein P [Paenibacillus cellulosilyticus]QKS43881.1 aminomethyl-transferring glycine dehydrogenase subunit GcvPA [Paenibacillus cellulosilyticus]
MTSYRHRYLPMTDQDEADMLQAIGLSSIDDLFRDIPDSVRYKETLPVSAPLDEFALWTHLRELSERNTDTSRCISFLGAGLYDHHIPAVIGHLISRSEFYTAYTPYQPEISQGELQAIFEFQSYICELTAMPVANASMYDGPTALAEAGLLAAGATRRKRLVVSRGVHPEARQLLATSARGLGLEIAEVDYIPADGTTDPELLEQAVNDQTAAVIVQSPNFFGCIERIADIAALAHAQGALLAVSVNPLSLGLLEPPGRLGADIVVGDAQPLGIPQSFGGPTCGFFAVAEPLMRRMPGRIVGQTVDRNGKRGFVLTLQAREQHIRREKATSNICSNQALLALCAAVYLSVMGRAGIQEAALLNTRKAHYAAAAAAAIPGYSMPMAAPFFNEFILRLPDKLSCAALSERLLNDGILAGYDLGQSYPELTGHMLLAVTEKRTRADIDRLLARLEEYA